MAFPPALRRQGSRQGPDSRLSGRLAGSAGARQGRAAACRGHEGLSAGKGRAQDQADAAARRLHAQTYVLRAEYAFYGRLDPVFTWRRTRQGGGSRAKRAVIRIGTVRDHDATHTGCAAQSMLTRCRGLTAAHSPKKVTRHSNDHVRQRWQQRPHQDIKTRHTPRSPRLRPPGRPTEFFTASVGQCIRLFPAPKKKGIGSKRRTNGDGWGRVGRRTRGRGARP